MKNLQDIEDKLSDLLPRIKKYLPAIFVCLVLGIYAFLFYRVTVLTNSTPSTSSTATQTAKVPRIDPKVIQQLQSLQDNSSQVQTLFDQARQNPFQE